jgi:hypothetical protein
MESNELANPQADRNVVGRGVRMQRETIGGIIIRAAKQTNN